MRRKGYSARFFEDSAHFTFANGAIQRWVIALVLISIGR
jgi:hypothetical protein